MTGPASAGNKRGLWAGLGVAALAACCAVLPAAAGAVAGGAIAGRVGILGAVAVAVLVAGLATFALRRRKPGAC